MTDGEATPVAPVTEVEKVVAEATETVEAATETVAEAVVEETQAVAEAVVADAVPEIIQEAIEVTSRSTEELWRLMDTTLSEISEVKAKLMESEDSEKNLDNTVLQPLTDQITNLASQVAELSKLAKPEPEATTTVIVPDAAPDDPEKVKPSEDQTPVCRIW